MAWRVTADSGADNVCGWVTRARQSRPSTVLTASSTNSRQSSARMEKNQSGCDGEPLIGSARNSSLRTRHGVRSLPSGWVDLEDTSELRLRKILHLQLTANPISHSLVGGAHSVTLRLF